MIIKDAINIIKEVCPDWKEGEAIPYGYQELVLEEIRNRFNLKIHIKTIMKQLLANDIISRSRDNAMFVTDKPEHNILLPVLLRIEKNLNRIESHLRVN